MLFTGCVKRFEAAAIQISRNLLNSPVHKILCFSFAAFRAVNLLPEIRANLKCGYFRGLYTLYMLKDLVEEKC